MKFIITLFLLLLIAFVSKAQEGYRTCFYPDSIKINNEIIDVDSTEYIIDSNGKSRFILWEHGENKLSVLFKVQNSDKRIKIKSRVEEYKKGRWRNPHLKIVYFHDLIPSGLTRWSANYKIFHFVKGKAESGLGIDRQFENEVGEIIEITGYVKIYWYNIKNENDL